MENYRCKYFKDIELVSTDLIKLKKTQLDISPNLRVMADVIREYLGTPVLCNTGTTSRARIDNVGGLVLKNISSSEPRLNNCGLCSRGHTKNSLHYTGHALDLHICKIDNAGGDRLSKYNELRKTLVDGKAILGILDVKLFEIGINIDRHKFLEQFYYEDGVTWLHIQDQPVKSGNRIFKA
jgi:hypothetical protein